MDVPSFYTLKAPSNAQEHIAQVITPETYAAQVKLGWPNTAQDLKTTKSAKTAVALLQNLDPEDGLRFSQIRPALQYTLTRTIVHTTARLRDLYKAMFEVNTDVFEALAELPRIQGHAHVDHFRTMTADLAELTTPSSQLDRLTEGIKLLDGLFFPVYLERKDQMWNSVGFPKLATLQKLFTAVEGVAMKLWPNKSESPRHSVDKFFELIERVTHSRSTKSTVHNSAHIAIEAVRERHRVEPFSAETLRSYMANAYSCQQLIFNADRQDASRPEQRGQRLRSATFVIDGHSEREAGTAQAAAMQEPPGGATSGPPAHGASCSPEQVAVITRMIGAAYAAEGGREGAQAAAAARAALAAEAEVAAMGPDGKGGRKGGKGSKSQGT